MLRLASFATHELGPERALGRVLIVRPTHEMQILCCRLAPARDRLPVVVFEPRALRAASSALAYERAPAAVALPHRAPPRRRDVAGGGRAPGAPGAGGRRELPLLDMSDVELEHALDHRGDLP